MLFNDDCLKIMDELIAQGVKVDLVLTDPPYGTTACKWDSIIPFDDMWLRLNQLIKPNGAIVLFGSEPFSSALRISNIKSYKYDWIWVKNFSTNFLHAKTQPLRKHELIHVFYNKSGCYYPIKSNGYKPTQNATGSSKGVLWNGENKHNYIGGETTRFPNSVLESFKAVDPKQRQHPTQKPVLLLEYLIKTYTLENELVLDFTMGSGSTGVACVNTNRKFIGIELDKSYFDIAIDRINDAIKLKQRELE